MKTILSILVAATFAVKLSAADTNTPALPKANSLASLKIGTLEATNFYDQEMIVTGKVAQVTIRPSVTFLNLDQPHPDSPFTVVIFHGHSSFYGDANKLKGRSIEIKGKIKNYHDKPEIALDSTNQLTVLGVTNLSLFLNPPVTMTNAPAISTPTNAPPSAPSTNSIPEIM
jgi:DNA/RNA endonuclease YhcR with UshA esterase domain